MIAGRLVVLIAGAGTLLSCPANQPASLAPSLGIGTTTRAPYAYPDRCGEDNLTAAICDVDPEAHRVDAGLGPDGRPGCICQDPRPFIDGGALLIDALPNKARLIDAGELEPGCHYIPNRPRCDVNDPEACFQYFVDPVQTARTAYAHGFAGRNLPATGPIDEHDGDNHLGICTTTTGYVLPPPPSHPNEDAKEFLYEVRGAFGCGLAIETEHQWCRWYGGAIVVAADDAGHSRTEFPVFRALAGERVSVAGDWVTDEQDLIELHETRMHITTREDPAHPGTWHLLTSGFFADKSAQRDHLQLTVPIPRPPSDAGLDTLKCRLADLESGGCEVRGGTRREISADSDAGVCRVVLRRVTGPMSTFECGRGGDIFQPNPTPCPCNTPGCDPGPGFDRCNTSGGEGTTIVAYAGDVRAFWVDPQDLWECSCACADPSQSGATIVAPVQGCAMPGLAEDKLRDRVEICNQVCRGLTCGSAPACRIGSCAPMSGPPSLLRAVADRACVPPLIGPRMSSSGDYRVDLLPESKVRVGAYVGSIFVEGGSSVVSGSLWINDNRAAPGRELEFASAALRAADFEVETPSGKLSVRYPVAFGLNRFKATTAPGGLFAVAAHAARVGGRALVDDVYGGTEFPTEGPMTGTFDPISRTFSLFAEGASPDGGAVRFELAGRIANVPPVAEPGGPRVEECTSPAGALVDLDASASSDPDPGDAVTHIQWFESDAGLGNLALQPTELFLGKHSVSLHVYDRELASDSKSVSINVVDTTPPDLSLVPSEVCIWPPNHKFALLRLGSEVETPVADACDTSPAIRFVSVTPTEPADALGSGSTSPDVVFGKKAVCVRVERSGTGDGRTYAATVEATDSAGNISRRPLRIIVAHDRRGFPSCLRPLGLDEPDSRCTQ